MPETTEVAQDFVAFLSDRSITQEAFSRMPDEMREYLREAWQIENHVLMEPAGQPKSPMPKVGSRAVDPETAAPRIVLWVGAACLVLILVAIIVPSVIHPVGYAGSPTVPTTTSRQPTPAPERSPSALPPPFVPPADLPEAAASARWFQVADLGGAAGPGRMRTAPFTISGPKWRVQWMTRPAAGASTADLRVDVFRADGSVVGPAALVRGESEGEAVLRGRGQFLLEITSGQNYLVRAYDYR